MNRIGRQQNASASSFFSFFDHNKQKQYKYKSSIKNAYTTSTTTETHRHKSTETIPHSTGWPVSKSPRKGIRHYGWEPVHLRCRLRESSERKSDDKSSTSENGCRAITRRITEPTRGSKGNEHLGQPLKPVQTVYRIREQPRDAIRGRRRNNKPTAAVFGRETPFREHQDVHGEGIFEGTVANPQEAGSRSRSRGTEGVSSSPRSTRSTATRRPSTPCHTNASRRCNEKDDSARSNWTSSRMEDVLQNRRNAVLDKGTPREPGWRPVDSDLPVPQGGSVSLGNSDCHSSGRESCHVTESPRKFERRTASDDTNNEPSSSNPGNHRSSSISTLNKARRADSALDEQGPSYGHSTHGKAPGFGNSVDLLTKERRRLVTRNRRDNEILVKKTQAGLVLPMSGGCTGSTPEPIMIEGSDGVHLAMTGDRIRRPPAIRPFRNVGMMSFLPTTTLNLATIRSWDPSYLEVFDVISKPAVFQAKLKTLPYKKRVSRYMRHHQNELLDNRIISPASKSKLVLPMFTVPKKDGTLRLITDGRALNDNFEPPPSMDLPRIHDVIAYILDHQYVAQADARAYFFQFPLAPGIRTYFGVKLSDGRGTTFDAEMNRMPMGFSWAPAIAQRTSNVIVRDLGICWVDNFAIAGHTSLEFAKRREEFLSRVRQANMIVDNTDLIPTQRTTMVGVEMCLVEKRYRMDPAWVLKALLNWRHKGTWTARVLYEMLGMIIWHSHVTRRPLCHLPFCFQLLGEKASALALRKLDWDQQISVPSSVETELSLAFEILAQNEWCSLEREQEDSVADIWTDASSSWYAWFAVNNKEVIASGQGTLPEEHIFYSELRSALEAITNTHRALGEKRGGIKIHIDNAAAARCIERRISTNFTANVWLAKLPKRQITVKWVSSANQEADIFTRPALGELTPIAVPQPGSMWMPSRQM
jgi:hypothetical protein